tara:strand:- start:83 stop:226 length:144 start_codon:yes stop_codon:yes gene_type:complete
MSKFIHPNITNFNLKKERERKAEEALKAKELQEKEEEELFRILTQAH